MAGKSSAAKTIKTDVAVVGGGHAGCALSALLSTNGVDTVCIDQDDPEKTLQAGFDGRTTAISSGSQKVIAAAGAWDDLANHACPILDIEIMESGSSALLEFLADDVDGSPMGWIIENRLIRQGLYKRLAALPRARHLAPARVCDFSIRENEGLIHLDDGRTIQAQLIVGADGRNSFTREWMGTGTRGWSYGQRAIACVIYHTYPHGHKAIEDFRSEGPFAILPMTDGEKGQHRSSIVWTEHASQKESALLWDETTFNAALNERCPSFYGDIKLAGKRFSYPLSLAHAHSYIGNRMALVADAAHGIHPIAGQGLNLGLRDIAALAELLIMAKQTRQDLGGIDLLRSYQNSRQADNMAMAGATDTLNHLFSNDSHTMRIMRKAGLFAVQRMPAARRFFMKQAMGASGLLPNLIKTGKLRST